MVIGYTKHHDPWADGPGGNTPIDSGAMNAIEAGLKAACDYVDAGHKTPPRVFGSWTIPAQSVAIGQSNGYLINSYSVDIGTMKYGWLKASNTKGSMIFLIYNGDIRTAADCITTGQQPSCGFGDTNGPSGNNWRSQVRCQAYSLSSNILTIHMYMWSEGNPGCDCTSPSGTLTWEGWP